MCFATSALFLLCTVPGIILLIGKVKWSLPRGANAPYEVRNMVIITTIATAIVYVVLCFSSFKCNEHFLSQTREKR